MKVLAIDTSNYPLGVAIIDGDTVIGEYITNIKKNHSLRVMPAIQALCEECGIKPAQLERIVVAEGPGSYTGVRIGVTIAKTLAWTLQIPLVGVSSLEALAASVSRYFPGYVSPIFDARRGQAYTGLYRFVDGRLMQEEADQLALVTDWAHFLKEKEKPVLFVGNDVAMHREAIAGILGKQATYAFPTELNPRPAELAFLGRDREPVDVHSFVPNYIRLAEAEAKWLEGKNDHAAK